jgi:formylglycine-generating enzyme required for sulfatase activity
MNSPSGSLLSPFLACIIAALSLPGVEAAPVVNNIAASQRPGTKLVDITYDLEAIGWSGVAVALQVSSDAGATWTVPVVTVSGAIGANVAPGTGKAIVWDAGTDWPRNYSTQMRFRVTADDGVTPIAGFSYIPPGSFTMGSTSGDAEADEIPVTVAVSGFYMQQTETTKALWDEVRIWGLSNGYTDLGAGAGKASNHPVQSISWWDVVKWCNARSEKEGLNPVYSVSGAVMKTDQTVPSVNWSANGYRLPTEAEWEKAARGGVSGKRFPWGTDTISHEQANYYGSAANSYDQSAINNYQPSFSIGGFPYTSPVASFAANGFALHDISGNVWEWCWDWYGAAIYVNGATDPKGATSGTSRIRRGGSWGYAAYYCRAADRNRISPNNADSVSGFRPVRSGL